MLRRILCFYDITQSEEKAAEKGGRHLYKRKFRWTKTSFPGWATMSIGIKQKKWTAPNTLPQSVLLCCGHYICFGGGQRQGLESLRLRRGVVHCVCVRDGIGSNGRGHIVQSGGSSFCVRETGVRVIGSQGYSVSVSGMVIGSRVRVIGEVTSMSWGGDQYVCVLGF